jgi:hypothetical protein
MSLMFLADAVNLDAATTGALAGGVMGAALAMIAGILIFAIILAIALWVYTSLAFTAIGRKTGYAHPGLAWIPLVGPQLIAVNAAGMHWWPIILLVGMVIPVVGGILVLVNAIFFIIWMWKTFQAVGKPGWWAIFQIIPILNIVYLVFIGIAAWGNSGSESASKPKKR